MELNGPVDQLIKKQANVWEKYHQMSRCIGTTRGKCGYPLKSKFEIERQRCCDCYKEWVGSGGVMTLWQDEYETCS